MATSILKVREVTNRTKLSRSTIYSRVADGTFPEPISLGPRAVGWIEAEVEDWLQQRIDERGLDDSARQRIEDRRQEDSARQRTEDRRQTARQGSGARSTARPPCCEAADRGPPPDGGSATPQVENHRQTARQQRARARNAANGRSLT